MYYKVIKDGKIIDVLDHLIFVKYQKKHGIMVLCDESEAQGIVSSDSSHVWHINYLYKIPVEGYDTVELEEIDKYEYAQLKVLNMKDPQTIIDEYTLLLIEEGII